MEALLRIIPLILFWLFSSSGAFGFFGLAEKSGSGEIFSDIAFFASEDGPQSQCSCLVDVVHAYDCTVESIVWTKFDPLGLQIGRTYTEKQKATRAAQNAYGRAKLGNRYKAANRAAQIKTGFVLGVTAKGKLGRVSGQATLGSADVTSTHQMDGASETTINGQIGAEISYDGSLVDAKIGISKTGTAGISGDKSGNLDTIEEQHSIIGVDVTTKSGSGFQAGMVDGDWHFGPQQKSNGAIEGSAKAQVDSSGRLSSTVSFEVGVGYKFGFGWSGEAYNSHLDSLNNQAANEIEEKYGVRPRTESDTPAARPKPQRCQDTEEENEDN